MAKFTPLLGNISGKIAGNIFASNKGGFYIRSFRSPVNPNTTAQALARANFAAQVSGWHALSDALKQDWNTFAANYFKPKYPVPGVTYSGFNAYVSLNNELKHTSIAGGSGGITGVTATYEAMPIYDNVPPALGLSGKIKIEGIGPAGSDLETAIVTDFCSCVASTGVLTMGFRLDANMSATNPPIFSDAVSDEDVTIIVTSSLPGTQLQEFGKNPKYRLYGKMGHPNVSAGPTTPGNAFEVTFTPYDTGYKYSYQTGEAVTFSAFLMSAKGQTFPLGSVRCVLT